MLQTILMLVLGSGTLEAPRLDPRELSDAIEAGTSSLDDAEARLLLADVAELRTLGDELGGQLIGSGPDDFEERLAVLFDEEKFAAFLGGTAKLAVNVLDRPDLVRALEGESDPPAAPKPGTVGAKFVESCERLNAVFGEDTPLAWLHDQRDHVERAHVLSLDSATIGRQLIEDVYDPAATPRMAAVARSIVRFVARMLVVRHVATTGAEPPVGYVDGLFEASAHDVENLGSLLASAAGGSWHGFPRIDLRLESVMKRVNQRLLRQAFPRWPGVADGTDQGEA
jgi:hypothetical protein